MQTRHLYNFENPFPNQFPVIAGRIKRFDQVVMKLPSIVKIVAELFARVRGEKPVPMDSLRCQLEFPALEIVMSISFGAVALLFLNPVFAIGLGVTTFIGSRYMGLLEDSANARYRKELLNSFSHDEIHSISVTAMEFGKTELYEKLKSDMTGYYYNLNYDLPGFLDTYFFHADTLSNYAKTLNESNNILPPSRTKVINALRFFFSHDNSKPIERGQFAKNYLLSVELKKLKHKYERRLAFLNG